MVELRDEPLVIWVAADGSGDLAWPEPVPLGEVIDLSRVTALGSWAHAVLRAHPGQDVVGATPAIKRQLERAGLSLRWRDPTVRIGVTSAERVDLLGG